MENASKALIMVGGILITVMVISLCMYLFTSARGVADASEKRLQVSQIEGFNRFFVNYPNEITGLDVYNIIGKCEDINNTASSLGTVTWSGATKADVKATENFIKKKYRYEYEDTDGDGLIDVVQFTKE